MTWSTRAALVSLLMLVAMSIVHADLLVYIDDTGPSTDTILSYDVLAQATHLDPGFSDHLPVNFALLFSEYEPSDDALLVVSHGEVWVVPAEHAGIASTLEESLLEQGIEYLIVEDPPRILVGEVDDPIDTTPPEPSDGSGSSRGEPAECSPSQESVVYCPDGSVRERCTCIGGSFECDVFECPEPEGALSEETLDEERAEGQSQGRPEPSEPGFFARLFALLFGWLG